MATNESFAELSDEELIHRYRNSHDMQYVGELYLRYTSLVFGVSMKYFRNEAEAEDATMQVFEQLIGDLKKHHILVFKPWLHTVVKNHCLMKLRKTSSQNRASVDLKKDAKVAVENPEDNHLDSAAEKEFMLTHLHEGLSELKDEQRMCLELFYLKEVSYQEIQTITGLSYNEVKSHIQNGKRNLKNYITAKNAQH